MAYNGDVEKMVEALQGVDVFTAPQICKNAVEIAEQVTDLKLLQITSAGFVSTLPQLPHAHLIARF